ELFDEAFFVFCRAAQVRTGLRCVRGKLRRLSYGSRIKLLAAQSVFSAFCPYRRWPYVGQPDPDLLHRAFIVQCELDSHRRRGKVADFAFQLDVSASAPWRRTGNANFSQDLVMLQ